jgi:hypothetical protein
VDTVHTLFGRTNRTVVSSPAPRKYYFQAFSNKAGQVMLLPSAHDHEQVLDHQNEVPHKTQPQQAEGPLARDLNPPPHTPE